MQGTNKIGSVGVPLPDVHVGVVDAEDGMREMPAGEVGELVLCAPQCMSKYWNNPVETAETLRVHPDGRTWIHAGDLAYIDADGFVFLVDRKKEMTKTNGSGCGRGRWRRCSRPTRPCLRPGSRAL